MEKQNFYDLSFDQLKKFLVEKIGVESKQAKMRAEQLFSGVYKKGLTNFTDLTTVTKDLRKDLDNWVIETNDLGEFPEIELIPKKYLK